MSVGLVRWTGRSGQVTAKLVGQGVLAELPTRLSWQYLARWT
jgi:hypothetical protein